MKFKILSFITLLSLGLFSVQSHAAGYAGSWTVTRNNTVGSFLIPLRNKSTHFCFLTKVEVEETDSGGEHARCRVWRSSGSDWFFEANIGRSSDADVSCSAVCYSN